MNQIDRAGEFIGYHYDIFYGYGRYARGVLMANWG